MDSSLRETIYTDSDLNSVAAQFYKKYVNYWVDLYIRDEIPFSTFMNRIFEELERYEGLEHYTD